PGSHRLAVGEEDDDVGRGGIRHGEALDAAALSVRERGVRSSTLPGDPSTRGDLRHEEREGGEGGDHADRELLRREMAGEVDARGGDPTEYGRGAEGGGVQRTI